MTKPRLLDLFCGAGGAAMGYHRAGLEVVGVDIKPQPHYPFEFHQGDALAYLADLMRGWDKDCEPAWALSDFDAIHASPPCQAYSSATNDRSKHPDLYAPTRDALVATGVPYVIENVIGAPYSHGFVLCGSMFPLPGVLDPEGRETWVQRHRNFETSWYLFPPRCDHDAARALAGRPITVTGKNGPSWEDYPQSRKAPSKEWPALMGMPWATAPEAGLAIPPAYTEMDRSSATRLPGGSGMTYDDLPFEVDDSADQRIVVVEYEPRKHVHAYHRQPDGRYLCFGHAEPVVRDEVKARRGKSSARLGKDGERRSEKRYGWRKVGEFGGITDLEGTLAIVQQKTSRRPAPPAWMGIFRQLEGRAGGKVPLILLSFVRAGVDTEDFIVVRGRDWLSLHGKDEAAK